MTQTMNSYAKGPKPDRMGLTCRATFRTAALLLFAAVALLLAGESASATPDLSPSIRVEPAEAGGNFTANAPVRLTVTVWNNGSSDAPGFAVAVWCSDPSWPRHLVSFPALGANSSATVEDPLRFTTNISRSVTFTVEADPEHTVPEYNDLDNVAALAIAFGRPSPLDRLLPVGGRANGTDTIPTYATLVLVVDVDEGETLLFQAESQGPFPFDQYMLDEEGWAQYRASETDPTIQVKYFSLYSATNTTHVSFSTSPLPRGRYFVVIENDERLNRGVPPAGDVKVTYAVAAVGTQLPPAIVAIIMGAAAAAIIATVKWRPAFDVRSPLLEIPPPEPESEADEEEQEDEEPQPREPPRPPREPR